jgi:hypothetical protein
MTQIQRESMLMVEAGGFLAILYSSQALIWRPSREKHMHTSRIRRVVGRRIVMRVMGVRHNYPYGIRKRHWCSLPWLGYGELRSEGNWRSNFGKTNLQHWRTEGSESRQLQRRRNRNPRTKAASAAASGEKRRIVHQWLPSLSSSLTCSGQILSVLFPDDAANNINSTTRHQWGPQVCSSKEQMAASPMHLSISVLHHHITARLAVLARVPRSRTRNHTVCRLNSIPTATQSATVMFLKAEGQCPRYLPVLAHLCRMKRVGCLRIREGTR